MHQPFFLPAILFIFFPFLTKAQQLAADSIAQNVMNQPYLSLKGEVDCTDPVTTVELRLCSNLAFQESHLAMEKELSAILDLVENERISRAVFIDGQQAWVKYRNANCALFYEHYHGGTLAPVVYLHCLKEITDQRRAELAKISELIRDH